MFRVRPSLLVLLGLALLATRFISSADSSPRVPARDVAADFAEEPAQDPSLDTMRAEVERLRERSQSAPTPAPPARDPFNFGRQPERVRPPVVPAVIEMPTEVRPVLPQLVAVIVDAGTGTNVQTAVFATADSVALLSTGESIGAFRIDAISPEAVELVHRDSGRHYTMSLK